MTKLQFIISLHNRLSCLPKQDAEDRLRFYSEMIEDRMEDGLSEEDAVAAIGNPEDIAAEILAEVPLMTLAREKLKSGRRLKTWEIILLAVGSPVWGSLLIAALSVVLSLYISLWAVVVSLWAVFAALIGSAVGLIAAGIGYLVLGAIPGGLAILGAALVLGGLSIFMFYGCMAATKGSVWLTKRCCLGMKKRMSKKEAAQ